MTILQQLSEKVKTFSRQALKKSRGTEIAPPYRGGGEMFMLI